jgi:hypothetical protein
VLLGEFVRSKPLLIHQQVQGGFIIEDMLKARVVKLVMPARRRVVGKFDVGHDR